MNGARQITSGADALFPPRRINPNWSVTPIPPPAPTPPVTPLLALANILKRLSWDDMNKFADILYEKVPCDFDVTDVARALVETAKEVAATEQA